MICSYCGKIITENATVDANGTVRGCIICRILEGPCKGYFEYFHEKCADAALEIVEKKKKYPKSNLNEM